MYCIVFGNISVQYYKNEWYSYIIYITHTHTYIYIRSIDNYHDCRLVWLLSTTRWALSKILSFNIFHNEIVHGFYTYITHLYYYVVWSSSKILSASYIQYILYNVERFINRIWTELVRPIFGRRERFYLLWYYIAVR